MKWKAFTVPNFYEPNFTLGIRFQFKDEISGGSLNFNPNQENFFVYPRLHTKHQKSFHNV